MSSSSRGSISSSSIGEKPLVIACIGGGQLGRMMALEAPRLNLAMRFLDAGGADCPAAQVVGATNIVQGSLQDADKIVEVTKGADVVTVEIEHVNVEALAQLEQEHGVNVQPSARVLGIIRDKYQQKVHFARHNIPLPGFFEATSVEVIRQQALATTSTSSSSLPLMLKTRRGGYDGRGNAVLRSAEPEAIHEALQKLGVPASELQSDDQLDNIYAEHWVDFVAEVAVMVVRSAAATNNNNNNNNNDTTTTTTTSTTNTTTTTRSYPAVNAIQQDSICRVVLAPARGIPPLQQSCEALAIQAIDSLGPGASGVFGVEMFITADGQVLLNEVAPRPHNTGHYTQDACTTSQFENHLRAICGLPLGGTDMKVEAAAMVNVLGNAKTGSMADTVVSSNLALQHMPNATVHWYGKLSCRAGRKMGHINLTGHSHGELQAHLEQLLEAEGIPKDLLPAASSSSSRGRTATTRAPVVGIIMGSQSDLPTMNAAVEILKQFDIPYEVDIVSAHRTPDKLMAYSRSAATRGLRVIIAGAGGAAHLPGMVAAMTPLPVVGVPVKTSSLSGVDSLYSIVQMPRGVPVATVAIGNAMNAGLLAVRILSTSRPALRQKMMDYQVEMKDMVDDMSSKLLDLGSDDFLEQMGNKNTSVNV